MNSGCNCIDLSFVEGAASWDAHFSLGVLNWKRKVGVGKMSASCVAQVGLHKFIFKGTFEGKLVPQDPNDEPASILLERTRNARAAESPQRARKRRNSPAL